MSNEQDATAIRLRTGEPSRHPSPIANALELTHVTFGCPDLERAKRFLTDFGLVPTGSVGPGEATLYMRAAGPQPYCYRVERRRKSCFIGFGLRVGSRDDLQALGAVPGAGGIQPSRHPGGGEAVVLRDPSGLRVEAICGQTLAAPLPHRAALPVNTGDASPRRVNGAQRPPVDAAEVLKLGHVVIEAASFQATCGWYTRVFGFLPSDTQVFSDGSPAVVFLRLNLGATPADHHTLAIAQGVMPKFGHAAFEVVDADAVGMGQRVLRERGWRHAWGIGRHILGSQIFDYWHDPWGFHHEHYSDGDLLTEEQPMGVHPVSREAMAQWGQPMPRSFTRPRLSPAGIVRVLTNVARTPDLSFRKLRILARTFG